MPSHGDSSIDLMDRLRERAKELTCLYQVQDVTGDPDRTARRGVPRTGRGHPAGWQHPDACWAKITVESAVYEPPSVTETPWVLRAPVVVMGKPVGAIEVFYEAYFPKADEGPFLREERRLLDHIACAWASSSPGAACAAWRGTGKCRHRAGRPATSAATGASSSSSCAAPTRTC